MEIISRNLEAKKLLKLKYQENPQTESEKQLPQPPAFTGLQSLKGLNQLGKYGMAAVVLAGTMLGATSCEKTEINKEEIWNVTVKDNSEEYLKTLIALVEKLIAQNQTNSDKYLDAIDSLRELIAAGNANDAKYYENIMALMKTIQAMMNNIEKNQEVSQDQAAQGLDLMNKILASLEKNNGLVSQYGNEIVNYLKTIEQAVLAGNDSIIAVLELMWTDINSGNTKLFEAVSKLGDIIETNNDELINTIIDIYEKDNISDDQRTKEVINAINEVKATIDSFKAIINNTTGELKAQLEEFLAMYNKNEITSQKLMEMMYNALIEGNTLDKLQLEQLHQIWVKIENGEYKNISEALNEIKNILSSIDSTLKEMSAQLGNIYTSIVNLNNDMKDKNSEIAGKLDEVIKNQDDQTAYLDALVYVNKQQKENLDKMNSNIEEAVRLLAKIENQTGKISMEELKAILKENNAEVIATIENALKELGITIDNSTDDAVNTIINAMNEFKNIINGNHEQMDTIINILSSIDLNTSLSNSQLDKLLKMVEEFKAIAESESASQAEINAKLEEIKNFLANIDSTLTDISAKLKDIFGAINKVNEQLAANQKDYTSYFEKLINNSDAANAYLAEMNKSQQATEANSETLIEKANEAIELLKSADAKLGDLNYANLIAELKVMDADLAAKLEEMIKNLGISINENTNNAADQIIAELEGLKSVLKANNADMKEVISQLSSLNLKADLNATQMAELIDLVAKLKSTVEDSGATQDDISAKLDDIKEFLASIDGTLKEILNTLNNGVNKFNQFYNEYQNNQDKLFGLLENIDGNVAELKSTGAALNNKVQTLVQTGDEIVSYLEQIAANQNDDITIEQLKELSAENLAAIKAMLENLGLDAEAYLDAKLGDVINAIKSSSIDLTTTNNMLQTLITLVSQLSNSIPNNGDMDTILNEILDAYKAGNKDLSDKLQAGLDKLQAIYDQLVEMYKEVADLTSNFKTFASLYETNTTSIVKKLDTMMGDITKANEELSKLNASMTVNNNYLNNAVSKADEIVAAIEKLNVNGNGNGITKAELEAILKDAGTSLEKMLNNLGITINDNTNNAATDIINAIKANSVDLTTTNNMLQTIITNTTTLVNVVANLENKDVTVNMGEVESKLDSLLQALNGGNSNLKSEMEALNQAIQDLIKEVQELQNNSSTQG